MGCFSNNPEDIKWDHYREDTLFHVFHVLVHQIFQGHAADGRPPPRLFELFFYTHQQITRRYFHTIFSFFVVFSIYRALIERRVEGLPDLNWLSVSEMKKPLGPGYRAGKVALYSVFFYFAKKVGMGLNH